MLQSSIYLYILGTTTELSMLLSSGVVVTCTLERIPFLDYKLGLEINIKKLEKQEKKTSQL